MFRSQSLSQSEKGIVHSLRYQSVRKEFLPGLRLLSMWIGSPYLHMWHGAGEILIQKNDVGDYLLEYEDFVNPKHPENYYVFKIPEKLQSHIQPYLEYISNNVKHKIDNDFKPFVYFPWILSLWIKYRREPIINSTSYPAFISIADLALTVQNKKGVVDEYYALIGFVVESMSVKIRCWW